MAGLESGVGLPGINEYRFDPGQVRVLFPDQKRQTTTATMIPGEIERKPFYKKTPLQQPPSKEQ